MLPVPAGARREPRLVRPLKVRWRAHHSRCSGPQLEAVAVGVRFQLQPSPGVAHFEFVVHAGDQAGDEDLPDTAQAPRPHGVAQAVPLVEITHHTDPLRIGRPGGKAHTGNALVLAAVRAQHPVDVPVLALAKQVQVEIADSGAKAVRVLRLLPFAPGRPPAQLVARHSRGAGQRAGEKIGVGHPLHGRAAVTGHRLDFGGAGQQRAQQPLVAPAVAAEHLERVVVAPRQ